MGWGLSMMSWSAVPACQRIPMPGLGRSASGIRVTSAISVLSSRFRSRAVVVGACQSAGRSAAILARLSRSGSGGSAARADSRACSASASAASFASQRASRVRATRRFSGSTWLKARSARSAS